jgi:hypothetical protein
MRKLFQFPGLSKLHLNTASPPEYATDINDEDFIQMGKAWPNMTDLQIPTNDDVPPRITHEGLTQFTHLCPRLHTLWISIDASQLRFGTDPQQETVRKKCDLTQLKLDLNSRIPDPVAFGALLAEIVPNLQKVTFFDDGELRRPPDYLLQIERTLKSMQVSSV